MRTRHVPPIGLTVGVDLSSRPERTAACVISWDGVRPSLELLGPPLDDDALIGLCHRSGVVKVAIDAPFGWPDAFVAAVVGWSADGVWSCEADARPVYRATDEHVRDTVGLVPLAVTADRIAHAAFRCAEILSQLAPGGPDRTGGGLVAEVYPAAALKRWGLPYRGYKDKTAQSAAIRETIVDGLSRRWPRLSLAGARASLVANDHLLDALICAVLAGAIVEGETEPIPPELRDGGGREGWIHLPVKDILSDPGGRSSQ